MPMQIVRTKLWGTVV